VILTPLQHQREDTPSPSLLVTQKNHQHPGGCRHKKPRSCFTRSNRGA